MTIYNLIRFILRPCQYHIQSKDAYIHIPQNSGANGGVMYVFDGKETVRS